MYMLILLLIQYAGFMDLSFGLTLPQCVGAEAAIELNENMRNQVITCTDVLATDVIRVYRVPASNIPALLLECNAENQCSNSAGYTALRSSNVVNVTFVNLALRTVFGNSSIVFEAAPGSNAVERCHLDVVCLTLPLCIGAKPAIELDENIRNQVIIGTDVLNAEVVNVYKITARNVTSLIVTCDASTQCPETLEPSIYTAMRSSNAVNLTIIQPALRSLFGGYIIVFEATSGSNRDERRCNLDVVYKPNTASCNAQFITTGSEWLAIGKCVIDKVFSFRDRYSCVWNENNGMQTTAVLNNQTSLNITLISGTSRDDSYYAMGCGFSKPLPEVSGNYNYTVIVYPGDVHLKVNFTGSNLIELPAVPTSGCPNGYITENTNVNCTCFTTNLGTPPGKVAWSRSNESHLAFNINRSHNNNNFTCEVRWGSRVLKQNVTTLHVAYGPDSVVISGPPDPFDTNGEQNLTLRCIALDYNPQVSYVFRRVNSHSVICSSNSCTLRPQPLQDNGVVYECLANNSATSLLSAKVNYTLNINYPPTFPPSIVNYSDNDVVYSGDFLNMTCIVKGGLPSNATKVNFNCSGKPDGNDIIGNDEVNSTITFIQLNDNDHGTVCTCTAKWKNYTWYTLYAQRILNVYYPPQRPNITERNKPMFPYLEGEYVSLSCDLIVKGNPPANLSWSFYRTANKSRTNETSVQLEFHSLGKNDNNKIVTCSAENNFTQTKDSTVMSAFVLQVYYRPVLELRQGEDNACFFTSEMWQCAVTEGLPIDIHCMADSNPVSGNITWHNANWTSVKFTNSSQLYIPSTNKSEHNGIFTCKAFTIKPYISDTRLPLNSTKDLYVAVKYMPCDINLILNKTATSITVMEKEVVTFVCRSNGRPTPTVILFNQDNSTQLFRVQGGVLNLADEISTLNYTITHASCEDTGNYACSGENDVGKLKSNNASLRVNCKPRYANGFNQNYNTTINYVGLPLQTTIELIAFPVPENLTVIGPVQNLTSSKGNVSTNIFNMTCSNTYASYAVSCNITLDNITSDSQEGYYRAFISNSYGNETLVIRVTVNETDGTELKTNTSSLNIAAIGGGVGAAVAIIIIFIVAVVLIANKRCQVKRKDNLSNEERLDYSNLKMSGGQVESNLDLPTMMGVERQTNAEYEALHVGEIGLTSTYEKIKQETEFKTKDGEERPNNSQYESLRVGEIGLASTYESMKKETKPKPQNGEKLTPYEKLETSDIGVVSHYDSIQQASSFNVLHSTGHDYANC